MSLKRIIAIAFAALIATAALASCNGQNSEGEKTGGEAKTEAVLETTTVVETTPDGGTVEKDADNNTIVRDKVGEIVSVEDKDGKSVDIDKYVEEHNVPKVKTADYESVSDDKTSSTVSSSSSSKSSSEKSKKKSDNSSASSSSSKSSGKSSSSSGSSSGSSSSSSSNTSSSTSSKVDNGIPKDNVEVDFNDL